MSKAKRLEPLPIYTNQFSQEKLSFFPVKENKSKAGHTWYTSQAYYEGIDGEKYSPEFILPQNPCWGFSRVFDPELGDDEKIPANSKGWQICYEYRGGTETSEAEENSLFRMMDQIFESICTEYETQVELGDDSKLPEISQSQYGSAMYKKRGVDTCVKPIYSFPKTKDEDGNKHEDKTKAERSYWKLWTYGKGNDMKVACEIHGPGDRDMTPEQFMDTRGEILPVLRFKGIYWGQHGPKSTYGASAQFQVVEANAYPGIGSSSRKRVLPRNDAPVEEEDFSSEGTDFQHPVSKKEESEEQNPADALRKASKKSRKSESQDEEKETKKSRRKKTPEPSIESEEEAPKKTKKRRRRKKKTEEED